MNPLVKEIVKGLLLEEYNYVGNCVTGLDDPYFQKNVCYDATEMAGIVDEYDNKFMQADEFTKKVNWPSDQLGPAEDTIYDFAYNEDKDIYWAYHIENDVHLFFIKDVLSEIKDPNDFFTVKNILEQKKGSTTAVYAGGFKPPTKGHFNVLKQALDENPEIDDFIVYVGKKERDGITQDQSMKIWNIYKRYLPFKVRFIPSTKPPIQQIYNYAKEHPEEEVLWVLGAREGREDDFKDIANRTSKISKYPNLELRTIVTPSGVSGTAARNAAKVSPDKFYPFIPDFLSDKEKSDIFLLLKNPISEGDPKVGTGKKPKGSSRRLYTDEDPKDTVGVKFSTRQDIVDTLNKKSFKAKSHARQSQIINLIHQRTRAAYNRAKKPNVKKRLKTALDYITKRKEASKKKTQRLKNQKENIDPKSQAKHKGQAAPYGSGYKKLKEALVPKDFNFTPYLVGLTKHMEDYGLDLKPYPKVIFNHNDKDNGMDILGRTAYYRPGNNSIVLYTYGRHPKDILRSFAHEMIHVHQNMQDRLGGINTTNVNQDQKLEDIEREAYEIGNILFRSYTNSLEDNKLINEGKKKDPFGVLAYAQELGRLREDEGEYKVYLDMDGVLADFDKRFEDLSGMLPRNFEEKYGKNKFWDFIDEENKVKFWVGIPVMPGVPSLINAVKKYDYEILTSPSAKKQSRLGKILWVRKHKNLFDRDPYINFKKAKEKHLIKPNLQKTDILIDDRLDTINRWNEAGGTGVHYQNINQVLKDLKNLGL